jgi:hypothetical protein
MCAPWLSPDDVQKLQRGDAQAWTVSDLPLLDAARQRLGDPETSRRKRRHDAAVAAEREHMAKVIDNLIEAGDDEYGGAWCRCCAARTSRTPWSIRPHCPVPIRTS